MWMMFWFGAFIVFFGSAGVASGRVTDGLIIMAVGVLFTVPAFVGMIRRAWRGEE